MYTDFNKQKGYASSTWIKKDGLKDIASSKKMFLFSRETLPAYNTNPT